MHFDDSLGILAVALDDGFGGEDFNILAVLGEPLVESVAVGDVYGDSKCGGIFSGDVEFFAEFGLDVSADEIVTL